MTRKLTRTDLEALAEKRGHSIVLLDNYQNVRSKITLQCPCGTTWTTTVQSYKNAKKTGCTGCKKKITSQTHSGKVTSLETKQKISKKASQRPGSLAGKTGEQHPRYLGGVARDKKKPSCADYKWKNAVRARCNFTCVVTLASNRKRGPGFECHHLNGYDAFEEQRYLPENGVYLTKEIHKQFHNIYGYGNNTEAQFVAFCEDHHHLNWELRKKELNLTSKF
jgi:hypothetical protein